MWGLQNHFLKRGIWHFNQFYRTATRNSRATFCALFLKSLFSIRRSIPLRSNAANSGSVIVAFIFLFHELLARVYCDVASMKNFVNNGASAQQASLVPVRERQVKCAFDTQGFLAPMQWKNLAA